MPAAARDLELAGQLGHHFPAVGVEEEDLDRVLADVTRVRLDARDQRRLERDRGLVAPDVRDAGAEHRDGAVGMGGGGFGEEQASFQG